MTMLKSTWKWLVISYHRTPGTGRKKHPLFFGPGWGLEFTSFYLLAEWKHTHTHIYIYGYGSIPINTIFSGMNIHLPAILMFTRGTRFWHTAIYIYIYIHIFRFSIPPWKNASVTTFFFLRMGCFKPQQSPRSAAMSSAFFSMLGPRLLTLLVLLVVMPSYFSSAKEYQTYSVIFQQ